MIFPECSRKHFILPIPVEKGRYWSIFPLISRMQRSKISIIRKKWIYVPTSLPSKDMPCRSRRLSKSWSGRNVPLSVPEEESCSVRPRRSCAALRKNTVFPWCPPWWVSVLCLPNIRFIMEWWAITVRLMPTVPWTNRICWSWWEPEWQIARSVSRISSQETKCWCTLTWILRRSAKMRVLPFHW